MVLRPVVNNGRKYQPPMVVAGYLVAISMFGPNWVTPNGLRPKKKFRAKKKNTTDDDWKIMETRFFLDGGPLIYESTKHLRSFSLAVSSRVTDNCTIFNTRKNQSTNDDKVVENSPRNTKFTLKRQYSKYLSGKSIVTSCPNNYRSLRNFWRNFCTDPTGTSCDFLYPSKKLT